MGIYFVGIYFVNRIYFITVGEGSRWWGLQLMVSLARRYLGTGYDISLGYDVSGIKGLRYHLGTGYDISGACTSYACMQTSPDRAYGARFCCPSKD